MATTEALGNPAAEDRIAARHPAGFVLVALLGAALVGVFGLAPVGAIHDAAHDTRHALGLPCH